MADLFDQRRDFAAELGESIMAWNRAEAALRSVLLAICQDASGAEVLIAGLTSVELVDALKASAEICGTDLCPAIVHVAKFYDRLREYRNYYVHGLTAFSMGGEEALGVTYMVSARGRYSMDRDIVDLAELTTLHARITGLHLGAEALLDWLRPQPGSRYRPPLPSPETLPLPCSPPRSRINPPLAPRPPPA